MTLLFSGLELTADDGTHCLLLETEAKCAENLHLLDRSLLVEDQVDERLATVVKLASGFAESWIGGLKDLWRARRISRCCGGRR